MTTTLPATRATPITPTFSSPVELATRLQKQMLKLYPQVELPTVHCLHAGMYHRTIKIPAGTMVIGALIKIPTTLMMQGNMSVFIGDDWVTFTGFHVIPAEAGRKQIVLAHEDTIVTMAFPTRASTVAEAEAEFTDEAHLLQSAGRAGDIIFNTHQE